MHPPPVESEPYHPAPRAVVVSERELEAFKRRIESEMDQRVADLAAGLEERVKHAVKTELVPYIAQLGKLDDILEQLAADRRDREIWRAKQEAMAEAEAKHRADEKHQLELRKGNAEVGAITASTNLAPIESTRRYKIALYTVLGSILAALLTLLGVVIGSQRRGP